MQAYQLTAANYHSLAANQAFLSASQLAAWERCEGAAHAQFVTGEYQPEASEAMLLGSYLHAVLLEQAEDLAALKADDRLYTRKGELRAAFVAAEAMIAAVRRQPLLLRFLAGAHEQIVTGEIAGQPFKAKIDVIGDGWIADLKSARSLTETWWNEQLRLRVPWYEEWNYWRAAAIYRRLHHSARDTAEPWPFYLVAVSKESPPDVELYLYADGDRYLLEERAVERLALRIADVKAGAAPARRCEACEYCRQTKVVRAPLVVRGRPVEV